MDDILSHPLGPLPWALSTSDGLLRKSNNQIFSSKQPSEGVAVAEECLGNYASIANLVQRSSQGWSETLPLLFGDGNKRSKPENRIDVVFSTYQENSISDQYEETRPGTSCRALLVHRLWGSGGYCCRESSWRKAPFREKLQGKVLYVTVDTESHLTVVLKFLF